MQKSIEDQLRSTNGLKNKSNDLSMSIQKLKEDSKDLNTSETSALVL